MSSRLEFQARSAGTTTTHSTAFEVLTRIGFIFLSEAPFGNIQSRHDLESGH